MCSFDNDEFEDKGCERCIHSYVCGTYDLACDCNDEIVIKDYEETENYMSCGGFSFRKE